MRSCCRVGASRFSAATQRSTAWWTSGTAVSHRRGCVGAGATAPRSSMTTRISAFQSTRTTHLEWTSRPNAQRTGRSTLKDSSWRPHLASASSVRDWRSKSVPSYPSALSAAHVPCSILRSSSWERRSAQRPPLASSWRLATNGPSPRSRWWCLLVPFYVRYPRCYYGASRTVAHSATRAKRSMCADRSNPHPTLANKRRLPVMVAPERRP